MKIKSIRIRKPNKGETALLTNVGDGYVQGKSGSLPDVDIDFQSDRRQEIKEYLEKRYNKNGKQRVFSAGTYQTLQLRAVFRDVCRMHGVPTKEVNRIISAFDEDSDDWTDLIKQAFQEKQEKGKRKYIYNFIQEYPMVIRDIRSIMGAPKSTSIHPSAIIITPNERDGEEIECFDFLPIRNMDGMLVSEIDGYSIDDIGLLKNDVLAIKELSKIKGIFEIVEREYGIHLDMSSIAESNMDDEKTYNVLSKGYTQDVFQFGSFGMTNFIKEMEPENISDLIAATSLYRPAALKSGSSEKYNDCKHGHIEPVYLWGTYDILKETYGVLAYQEQLAQMAREIGGFTIAEGVRLVKLISKKKTDKIHEMKDKFMDGALKKGCPHEDAVKIWDMIESGGSYLFNKSHATAYSVTSYVGAYLKANFPTAFYTVALEWAKDDDIPTLITEMSEISNVTVKSPNINVSTNKFITDYSKDVIYWSLSKISYVGVAATNRIIKERELFGEYKSTVDFLERIFIKNRVDNGIRNLMGIEGKVELDGIEFKNNLEARRHLNSIIGKMDGRGYVKVHNILFNSSFTPKQEEFLAQIMNKGETNPVDTRVVSNLIFSGCFDELEKIDAAQERWYIVKQAEKTGLFEIKSDSYPSDMVDKHYFWTGKQIEVSGIGSVDYKRIYDNHPDKDKIKGKGKYLSIPEVEMIENDGRRTIFCATIANVREWDYVCKKTGDQIYCGSVVLSQNKSSTQLTLWSDSWAKYRSMFMEDGSVGQIIIGSGISRYDDWSKKNRLMSTESSLFFKA